MKCLGPGSVLAAIVVARSVGAQPLPTGLALRWDAPPACPAGVEVETAVAQLLGRPNVAGASPCVAHARVTPRRRGGWRLRLTVTSQGAARHRTLDGATCGSVTEAAALVLALAIDPDAVAARPVVTAEPPPALPPPPPPPLPPPAPTPPETSSPPVRRPRAPPALRWNIRASVFGDLGSLPAATVGPSLAVGVSSGPWRAEAQAAYGLPQSTGGAARGGEFDLLTGTLVACGLAHIARVDVGGCGGVELGSVRGAAFGVAQPGSGGTLWLAASFAAMARVPLGSRWGVVAQVGGAVPVFRPRFVIDNVGAVFQSSAVSLRGCAGVEWYF